MCLCLQTQIDWTSDINTYSKLCSLMVFFEILLLHLQDITGWGENDRGVSFTFGGDIVKEYLRRFSCSLIARAHQVIINN